MEIHRPWIQGSDVLPNLFSLLSSYTLSLKIYQRRRKLDKPRFELSSLSQLKCLEEISLREEMPLGASPSSAYGDNALPTFLNHFPKLQSVIFSQSLVKNKMLDNRSGTTIKATHPIFHLNKVDVHCCDDALVLEWIIPALSSLQKLHITYLDPNATIQSTAFPKYATAAGESLQYLEARNLYRASDTDLQLLMNAVQKHATNLRSLRLMITGSTIARFEQWQSPIQVVVQVLLFLSMHSHLQHLIIGISQYEIPADGSSWNDMEDLLLATRFPALKSVEICLLKSQESTLVSVEPIIAAVPRLVQKRVVFVSSDDGV